MGFDLYGQSKQKGETYFRANVWGWRPIWKIVTEFCDDILDAEEIKRGNYNDFVKIDGAKSIMLATRLQSLIDDGTIKELIDVYEKNRNKEVKAEEILMKALDDWTEEQGATCGNNLPVEEKELWDVMYHKIRHNSNASYPMHLGLLKEFADFCEESDQGFKIG
jgi:hypothetical protein